MNRICVNPCAAEKIFVIYSGNIIARCSASNILLNLIRYAVTKWCKFSAVVCCEALVARCFDCLYRCWTTLETRWRRATRANTACILYTVICSRQARNQDFAGELLEPKVKLSKLVQLKRIADVSLGASSR